jgi:hypothetical protein
MGIMPLTSLGKVKIANGFVDEITKFFMREYKFLLKNGA